MIIKRSISVSLLTSMQAKIAFRWLGVAERVLCTKDFFIFAPKKARARKRRCSLHAQARLRFARCALLRLCRNACRAIFAFALMSKLLDANCLIIEKTNSNGENRRFSTSIPFKYLYNKSGGTISMSPLVFYSVIPKCDSPFCFG